jgi:hypothetical protein
MKTYRYFAPRESDWGVSDELWLPATAPVANPFLRGV